LRPDWFTSKAFDQRLCSFDYISKQSLIALKPSKQSVYLLIFVPLQIFESENGSGFGDA
jgi:hypothetical protein